MKAPKFKIHPYHILQAKKYGVTIDYSKNKDKKLDVFKDGKKIADIGLIAYFDYQSYKDIEKMGFFQREQRKLKEKHNTKDMQKIT